MSNNNENIKNVTNKSKLNNRTLGLKRWLSFIVTLSMIMSLIILPNITASAAAYTGSYSGGDGSFEYPYIISTADDLMTLSFTTNMGLTYSGAYFRMSNNISFDGSVENNFIPIGTSENSFSGNFDGNGYYISGLNVNLSSRSNVGLFGCIRDANITNVGVINSKFSGDNSVGAIVGSYNKGYVGYCYGKNNTISATNANAGGIIGGSYAAYGSRVDSCYNYSGSVSAHGNVGGIVGYSDIAVVNCYNSASVTKLASQGCLGGISGYGAGKVTNSYNIGTLSSPPGGESGPIHGMISYGNVNNSYYLSGCISNPPNTKGTSKTESQLKDSSMINLLGNAFKQDITNINDGYPILSWQTQVGAPIILATSGEDSKVTITWTPSGYTSGKPISRYILQRSTDGGETFKTIDSDIYSGDRSYVDNGTAGGITGGLTNGTTYQYRMIAVNQNNEQSLPSEAVTAKPYKVPEIPDGIKTEAQSKHAIKITWDNLDNGGDEISEVGVKVYTDPEYQNEITGDVTITANLEGKSIDVTNLPDKDTTYYFAVSATNKAGTGAITKIAGTTFTNPDAPTNLSAEVVSSTEIKLTWTAPENDGGEAVTSYNVYYREKAAEGETANEWTKAGDTAELTYVVGELTPGTLYEFKVTAMNGSNAEDESPDSAVIEIIPAKEPIAPVIGELISKNASIEISSVEVSDNFGDAVNKYSIYVSRKNEDGSFGEYTKLSEIETKTDSSSNILASGLEICVKKVSKKDALFFT